MPGLFVLQSQLSHKARTEVQSYSWLECKYGQISLQVKSVLQDVYRYSSIHFYDQIYIVTPNKKIETPHTTSTIHHTTELFLTTVCEIIEPIKSWLIKHECNTYGISLIEYTSKGHQWPFFNSSDFVPMSNSMNTYKEINKQTKNIRLMCESRLSKVHSKESIQRAERHITNTYNSKGRLINLSFLIDNKTSFIHKEKIIKLEITQMSFRSIYVTQMSFKD